MNALESIGSPSAPSLGSALPFMPRLLSADHAAIYLGISKRYLLDCVSKHKLPAPISMGRRVLWDRRILDQFVDALVGLPANDDMPSGAPANEDW